MEDGFEGDKTGGSSPGERCWESELRHWQYRTKKSLEGLSSDTGTDDNYIRWKKKSLMEKTKN